MCRAEAGWLTYLSRHPYKCIMSSGVFFLDENSATIPSGGLHGGSSRFSA